MNMEEEIGPQQNLEYVKKIHDLTDEMVEIQKAILSYVEGDSELDDALTILTEHKILDNESKFHDTLRLLSKISFCRPRKEHKNRVNDIIIHFKDSIQNIFSIEDISDLFASNFAVLLCLYENNVVDFQFIKENSSFYSPNFFFPEYFEHGFKPKYPEHQVVYDQYKDKLEEFRIKRKEYHSDSTLAQLIRNDDLEGFQNYISSSNTPLDSYIEISPFESTFHQFYRQNDQLIMYAAVFQAINIFKFLFLNLKKKPELHRSVILGGNVEIFHLTESVHRMDGFDAYLAANYHQTDLFDYIMNNYTVTLDTFLTDSLISSFNFQSFDILVQLHPEILTNKNYLNFIFGTTCFDGCRTFFDLLIDLPIIDVNYEYEILINV